MTSNLDVDQASPFDIVQLRADIAAGRRSLRITTHAQLEAFKDGLLLADLRYVFDHGQVIEIYPEEQRGLLYAVLAEHHMPAHIVVEDTPEAGVVVTAYIPDQSKWIGDKQRRKSRRKKS